MHICACFRRIRHYMIDSCRQFPECLHACGHIKPYQYRQHPSNIMNPKP